VLASVVTRHLVRSLRRAVALPRERAVAESTGLAANLPALAARPGLARLGVLTLLIIASGLVAIRFDHLYHSWHTGHESVATVALATAQAPGTVARIVLPAETAPWHQSTVYAPVDGAIERWLVDIGDVVHQGQLLCVIRTPTIDAQLAAARAQLQASQAQLSLNRADAEFARTTYERWRDSPTGVVSQQERDATQADYLRASARLKLAEAQLNIDQQQLAHASALSRLGHVTAPLSGVITARLIDVNQSVNAAAADAPAALYQIVQRDPIRILARVPQSLATQLGQPGLAAEVWIPEPGGARARSYRGAVTRSAGALDKAHTLLIEVDLSNSAHVILAGMLAQVAFQVPSLGTVTVPKGSLINLAGGAQVAVIDASHHVHLRDVTVARDDGDVVELNSGLTAGELIAEHASRELLDGELIATRGSQPSLAPTVALAAPATTH
jgi:RND family efflux transporter MFP subunit